MTPRPLRRPVRREEGPVVAGRRIYIGLRTFDPKAKRTRNLPGLSIRAFDFAPKEVHTIIVDALGHAAAEHQTQLKLRRELRDHQQRKGLRRGRPTA